MTKKLLKKIEMERDYLNVKFEIIDNINSLSSRQREKIFHLYWKKYWNKELWNLLRSIFSFKKKKNVKRDKYRQNYKSKYRQNNFVYEHKTAWKTSNW